MTGEQDQGDQKLLEMVLELEDAKESELQRREGDLSLKDEPKDKSFDLYNDKDRMLSDLSVKVENTLEKVGMAEERNSSSKKSKEKIEVPQEEPIISGPLQVCLNFGSEWKRRYLTVVDDCLYIWTSHK